MNLYGKTLFFRRGTLLKVLITYRCNLNCHYCNLKLETGKFPQAKESTAEQWLDIIDRFPVKIKEISIEGGEPTLYPGLAGLVNILIDKGFHIRLYTNLIDISELKKINKSYKFRVIATWHRFFNKDEFLANYQEIKKLHSIIVYELIYTEFPFSRKRKYQYKAEQLVNKYFFLNPERKIFIGIRDALKT